MKPIYYIIILFLLLGCKKNSKRWTEITIRVNNYITGEPIDDVTCGVGYYKSHTLKPDEWVFLDVGSPVNGVYHYEFKAPKAISYGEFSYDPSKYYPVDVLSTIYYDYGVNEYQMYLVPMGKMNEVYNNNNCFDDSDSLIVHYVKNISLPDYYLTKGGVVLGCVNHEGEFKQRPTGFYKYSWQILRNGVLSQTVTDTVELKPNEPSSILINY